MPWYKQGTVAVAVGQTTVTGTGTEFAANTRVGDAFQGPDGRWYEVTNIASDTVMSIWPPYQAATNAAGLYALAPMQGYVKDSADALRALVNQFGSVLAVLGNDPTQAGVRQALNLSSTDGLAEGATNQYLTTSRVLAVPLIGIDLITPGAIVATDTIIKALGKLQVSKADLVGANKAVAIEQGGTGAKTVAGARAALGATGPQNLFINPRFRVNQRGYVSGTAASAGQYTLDRIKMSVAGQSLSFAPSGAGVRATFPAGGCDQVVLGENVRGGVYTLSWVGTAVAKVNGVVIANGGQTPALPAGTNITINLSGGWAEDVMFQLGSVATAPDDRGYAAELFDCLYYGYALVPSVNFQGICTVSFVYSGLIGLGVLRFPRAMRANPTVSFLAGGPSSMVLNTPDGNSTPLTNLGVSVLARESCNLMATQGLSWDLGASSVLNFGAAAANLFFSAEV